jgi:hypothetical protein
MNQRVTSVGSDAIDPMYGPAVRARGFVVLTDAGFASRVSSF